MSTDLLLYIAGAATGIGFGVFFLWMDRLRYERKQKERFLAEEFGDEHLP